MPDNPIQIADAALYLIEDAADARDHATPTSSPRAQFNAAIALLKKQRR